MATDNLIKEINEDYRRDQLQRFWRSFGSYIVTISVCIIILTIGFVLWQNHRESSRQEWSAKFLAVNDLLEADKTSEAVNLLKDIQSNAMQEHQMLAAIMLQQLAPKEVTYSFDAENPYTDYGRLYAHAALRESAQKSTNSSYRLSREEIDAIALYQAGKTEESISALETLAADLETPQTMRERLTTLIPYLRNQPVAASAAPDTE